MDTFAQSARNRVRRAPNRGRYDAETIYAIVDEALICHVGLVQDGQPVVIPTLHARWEDELLLHGASTSRLIQHVQTGHDICVTVTLVDGLVLARSVFHHSVNYRSAVLFGRGRLITNDAEKMQALERFTERLLPSRWADARKPNAQELKATSVVAVTIDSASAKVRQGPPVDDEEDYALPVWAGELPVVQQWGALRPDPQMDADTPVPDYLTEFVAPQSQK
jgi:hypothetical protein